MKRMTIALPDELAAEIEQARRRRDTSASAIVRTTLEVGLVKPRQEALAGMIDLFDALEDDLADRIENVLATIQLTS